MLRISSQLEAQEWAQETVHTRAGDYHLTARRMGQGLTYWRLASKEGQGAENDRSGLALPSLAIGRNGVLLSANFEMQDLVGGRVRNLHDVLEGQIPTATSLVRLKTQHGLGRYLCLVNDDRPGRTELSFVAGDFPVLVEDQLFEALPIPMLKLDASGLVQRANRPAAALLPWTDLIGQPLSGLFEGLGRPIDSWITESLAEKGGSRTEFLRVARGREECFVQITLCPMDFDGERGLLVVMSDATELKSLEAQFVQSQKMQAIGQLAGGIAHDFNNLLTAMSGHCDLLLLRHGESDPDYADLDQIRQNANRAAALVGQLLAFSRKQNLQPEVLDLEATLSDHTHLLNRLVGEKTQLEFHHGTKMKPIRADKRQFEQVIMNLVVNARDAMRGTGVIRIETELMTLKSPLERDRVTVPAGEYCCITVSDEGCGIPQDKLKRVFEPFYTSKKTGEGTGLGLSTAYGIVKQSGGFIFVDSVVGVGTRFQMMFPAEKRQAALPSAATPQPRPDVGAKGDGVVLLVEDEAPVRAFASRALRLKGFTVIEASCAEEALDKLSDKDMTVDIFVTDVVMPGADGPTWVAEALKARPETKVLFVSGYAEERVDELRRNIPNSTFLPKPFSLNDLTSTVAQLH